MVNIKATLKDKKIGLIHSDLGMDSDGAWVSLFQYDGNTIISKSFLHPGLKDAKAERMRVDKSKLLEHGIIMKEDI